jgi:hypothetical protein
MCFSQLYRLLGFVLLLMIFLGCVQATIPNMPTLSTDKEKTCARECQAIYSQCTSPCGRMEGGPRTANQREQCLNNCNIVLSDCYSTCK